MVFLHLYMKFTQPLFIQGLMGLKGIYEAKPFALYILNKPAEGDLKRPFKQPPGLFGCKSSVSLTFIYYIYILRFGIIH